MHIHTQSRTHTAGGQSAQCIMNCLPNWVSPNLVLPSSVSPRHFYCQLFCLVSSLCVYARARARARARVCVCVNDHYDSWTFFKYALGEMKLTCR